MSTAFQSENIKKLYLSIMMSFTRHLPYYIMQKSKSLTGSFLYLEKLDNMT